MATTKLTVRRLYTDNNGNRNSGGKPGQGTNKSPDKETEFLNQKSFCYAPK